MAWTYVSKEIVASFFHIAESTLQDEWSNWAEALIAEHYGYVYIGTTSTITEEKHNGDGSSAVYVKFPPIVSVTSLALGTGTPSTLSSSSYKVFDDHIELINSPPTPLSGAVYGYRATFPVGVQNITITYVSGLAAVPTIVQFTAAEMIAELARFYKLGGADGSIKYSGPRSTLGQEQGVVARRGLAATLQSIMKNNLRKRVISLA